MSARTRSSGTKPGRSDLDGAPKSAANQKLKLTKNVLEGRSSSGGKRPQPVKALHSVPKTKSTKQSRKHSGADTVNATEEFTDQDIKFVNVETPQSGSSLSKQYRRPSSGGIDDVRTSSTLSFSGFDDDSADTGRVIKFKEILERSQETEPSKVYELDLRGEHIGSIANLEKFVKLRVLDLSSNVIRKIDNLHANTDLRELKLYDNRIEVLENLNNLEQLCHLQLQHNRLKTIGKNLKALKKLKSLRIDCNLLLKIDPGELAPCGVLTVLDISNNKLDSLAAVNSLPNLEELHAAGNRLRTVPDLGRCKKLQEVDLSCNRLTDVSGLKGMTKLTVLNLSSNNIITLNTLGKLKSLQALYLSSNRINSVKSLAVLFPNLELLNIADNKIDTWAAMSDLSAFSSLAELFISGNPVCLEDGERPHYHSDIQTLLPELDVLDGALLKRPSARAAAPVMRPMSANSVISARLVESQMKALANDMSSFEAKIADRFESLRTSFQHLPEEAPSSAHNESPTSSGRPTSRCSNRSRLQEARLFAEQHF